MSGRPATSSSATPRRGVRRGLALVLVAGLTLVGQVGRATHELLVPHRECTLHGLEHGAEDPTTGRAESGPAAAAAFEQALQATADGDHEEDRCLEAQLRKDQRCAPERGHACALDLAARAPRQSFTRALPRHGAPLLLLAPKGSPPV